MVVPTGTRPCRSATLTGTRPSQASRSTSRSTSRLTPRLTSRLASKEFSTWVYLHPNAQATTTSLSLLPQRHVFSYPHRRQRAAFIAFLRTKVRHRSLFPAHSHTCFFRTSSVPQLFSAFFFLRKKVVFVLVCFFLDVKMRQQKRSSRAPPFAPLPLNTHSRRSRKLQQSATVRYYEYF